MDRGRFRFLLLLIGAGLIAGPAAFADRIILKDGTVEESERVWESNGYVHFILRGTQTVEIRYSKALVDRIERKNELKKVPDSEPEPDTAPLPKAEVLMAAPPVRMAEADRRWIEGLQGIAFYDPRRAKRYWATSDSQHATLEGAVDTLARHYGQPAQWVLAHIGEENDLARIHEKLLRDNQNQDQGGSVNEESRSTELPSAVVPKTTSAKTADGKKAVSTRDTSKGIQFYDPRRPEKYWISREQRFRTLSEAINALAGIYQMSAEWVETHMGDSNELSEIHESLAHALPKSDLEKK